MTLATQDIQLKDIEIFSLLCCVVAIIVTVFRLCVRGPKNWWWDDMFAALGVGAMMLQTIGLWLRIQRVPALVDHRIAAVVFLYINNVCLYVEDWAARLALLYSIIRIQSTDEGKQRLHLLAIFFALCLIVNTVMLFAYCQANTAWQHVPLPKCIVPKPVPIYQICTGIIADAVLIYLPLRILTLLKSSPAVRRRLTVIFSASVLVTIACVTQSVISLIVPGIPQLIASLAEGFIALIICNLAVVTAAILHLLKFRNPLSVSKGGTNSSIRFHHFGEPDRGADSGVSFHQSGTVLSQFGSLSNIEEEEEYIEMKDMERSNEESERSRQGQTLSLAERWRTMNVDALEPETDGQSSSSSAPSGTARLDPETGRT